MRSLPLLLVAGLLGTACATADVDGNVTVDDTAPELETAPTAEPEDDETVVPRSIARLSTDDLTEACTIDAGDTPAGDVRIAFPEGWIVGECGLFDPDEVILDDDGVAEGVDIQWFVDPITFPTAAELNEDHDRFVATVSGLPAMRVEGHFDDDHPTNPGMAFTTWYVDLSTGAATSDSILVGTVAEGVEVDYEGSVVVLDLMARSITAQNPYEDIPDDVHAIALRTSIDGTQATVTYDGKDCLTLRNGGVAGDIVSQACELTWLEDDAVEAVALRWDEDTVVIAGFAHPDVQHVRSTVEDEDGDAVTVGAFTVANDNGPDVFAFLPMHDELEGFEAVGAGDVVLVEFEAVEVEVDETA